MINNEDNEKLLLKQIIINNVTFKLKNYIILLQ